MLTPASEFRERTTKLPLCCFILPLLIHIAPAVVQCQQPLSPCLAEDAGGDAPGRLQILPLPGPLKLAEANEIPLRTNGFRVHSAHATWSYYLPNGYTLTPDASKEVNVKYREGGQAYVEIVPEKLGKLQLQIHTCFEDGKDSFADVDGEVVLGDQKPDSFQIARGGTGYRKTEGTIYLDLSNRSKTAMLDPVAKFPGAENVSPIPADRVNFDLVASPNGDSPITINESTGLITALHGGHALIKSTFDGISVLTCVAVVENARFPGNGTVCQELVPPGTAAPKSGFENMGPPPKIKVRTTP